MVQSIFSPDGENLLVNSIYPIGFFRQNLDTGETNLVTEVNYPNHALFWSDAGTIYFHDPTGEILTVPSTGGDPRTFAQVPVECTRSWSASMDRNGEFFSCSVDEHRESDIWVIDNFGVDPGNN